MISKKGQPISKKGENGGIKRGGYFRKEGKRKTSSSDCRTVQKIDGAHSVVLDLELRELRVGQSRERGKEGVQQFGRALDPLLPLLDAVALHGLHSVAQALQLLVTVLLLH